MKRRPLTHVLLLVLAIACFTVVAAAEEKPAILSAAGYEDGFVLSVSGLAQGAAPESLSLYYVPPVQEMQEIISLPAFSNVQEVPVPLPLPASDVIVLTGLELAAGSAYHVQFKAMYADQTTVLSDIALVEVAQGKVPTTPEAIAFAEKTVSVPEGQTLHLPMNITPLGVGKDRLTYKSGNTKVATVDAAGIVTGISKGKATITAAGTTAEGKALKATISVQVLRPVAQIELNKTELTLFTGKKTSLKATVSPSSANDRSVIYASSNESVATVDKKGSIKGIAPGTSTITVSSVSNPQVTATCVVTVVKPISKLTMDAGSATLYVGQTLPLAVGYLPEDASIKSVTFKSSSAKYATVDENGVVTGVAKGKATITATASDGSGTKVSKSINVLQQPLEVSFKNPPTQLSVGAGKKITAAVAPANTSDKGLVWSSSDESIATVSKNGTVTPLYPGQVTITAASKNFPEIAASAAITVVQPVQKIEMSESKLNILVQTTAQLSYEILPEYATDKTVLWASSNTKVATVDQNGLVTAHKRGTATITVTSQDGSKKVGKSTVNVIQPLYGMSLEKDEIRVGMGGTGTLTAVLDPSDASNSKVRWQSSNPNVARVSGSSTKATVTGIAWGDAVITAVTDEGGYTDTATVHVGDYNEALEVVSLSLASKDGGGYTPFVQFRNLSNMDITHVSFIFQGYDINGGLLYMSSNHAYVFGEYLQELAPGWVTASSGFYYKEAGNFANIEKVRFAFTDYTTSEGVEWHISLTDRTWWEYATPEYLAQHPET